MKNILNGSSYNVHGHPYHSVYASPWPILTASAILQLLLGIVWYFNTSLISLGVIGLLQVLLFLTNWFYDIVVEATYEGNHTYAVQKNLTNGFILFIVSEVFFFFSFFWGFFHFSLAPSIWIGNVWPPLYIDVIDPLCLPLLNTVLLLTSGVSITVAHRAIIAGNLIDCFVSLIVTIFLGFLFLVCQWYEYNTANFTIEDSVFGSIFYLLTGFHGLHVLVGVLFLTVCLARLIYMHFTAEHHLGFEFAIWYWHFVDVVWLFLYIFVYGWGGADTNFINSILALYI